MTKIHFQSKDWYKKINKKRKNEIIHGDAECAIALGEEKEVG